MIQTFQAKPFKTHTEQIEILKERGLIISDEYFALNILRKISYYRLSAYSLTLRKNDIFYNNVRFEDIVQLYDFDAELRNLVLRTTACIEVAFRSYISYHHSEKYGNIGYLDPRNFYGAEYHAKFLEKLNVQVEHSDEIFVKHYRDKNEGLLPFWVAIETIHFDSLSKLFKNMLPKEKKVIAKKYYNNIGWQYIDSWLHVSVIARNISAHGGRFYNRVGLQRVRLPDNLSNVRGDSPFAYMFAIYKLLPDIQLKEDFVDSLSDLFIKYPFANLKYLGFPMEWKEYLK